jgi:hypothetical protein
MQGYNLTTYINGPELLSERMDCSLCDFTESPIPNYEIKSKAVP